MKPAHVLLVGDDEALMERRAMVLYHFWAVGMAEVDQGADLAEFADVVVMCDSIPEDRRLGWIATVRAAARPGVAGPLIVTLNGFDSGPRKGADATVSTSGGPGALVSAIYGLLMERGLESRGWGDFEMAG